MRASAFPNSGTTLQRDRPPSLCIQEGENRNLHDDRVIEHTYTVEFDGSGEPVDSARQNFISVAAPAVWPAQQLLRIDESSFMFLSENPGITEANVRQIDANN